MSTPNGYKAISARIKDHWTDENSNQEQIRAVDMIGVRDGKVSEKLAYVKD